VSELLIRRVAGMVGGITRGLPPALGAFWLLACGCAPVSAPLGFRHAEPVAVYPHLRAQPVHSATKHRPDSHVVQAQAEIPTAPPAPVEVDDFVRLALERHPRLSKAQFAIDAASGKYVQAGLYPNPVLAITGDELSDRTGPAGIWTAPYLTQEIVRAKKLSLAQAVAAAEVDQATLALLAERYAVAAAVRAAFFEALVLQDRVAILDGLAKLADEVVRTGRDQLANKQISQLDLLQLEVEREKLHADFESARRELPAAYRRLAATAGDPALSVGPVRGALDAVPQYNLDRVRDAVLASHPELRVAQVGVERARAAARRAEADATPNFSLSAGYMYQGQNRSNDWAVGFSTPLPVWNRNQGNIRTAKAELGAAIQDVSRVETDLAEKVAAAFRGYAAGAERAARYRAEVLPRAKEALELSRKAVKIGQFTNLNVLQAQRVLADAALEQNKSLADAWKSAAELSGLLLEEAWPPAPGPEVAPPPR
jgi:cobalt-zinc-cadmium efflux system outer membrane protein